MDVRETARAAFVVAAWLFVACAIVQMFLAGLGVFAGTQNFATHRDRVETRERATAAR